LHGAGKHGGIALSALGSISMAGAVMAGIQKVVRLESRWPVKPVRSTELTPLMECIIP